MLAEITYRKSQNRYRIVNEQDIREGMVQAQAYLARNLGHETDK
jgi:hypothetical protein